ncbi:MAG: ribosome maturation factor RimM [Lachnospiraceae bacterium]|nr:ribosome maturation factor RimM [Lachnospiraceae bacterium]
MDKESMLRVGVISSTHGIRGEVKVYPTTDDVNRFKVLKEAYIDMGRELVPVKVTGCKFFKNMVILKFKDIDNINDVEKYKSHDLLVTREHAVPLEEGEYFIVDLIGLKVLTDEDEEFGELIDVMETGANDVYIVKQYSTGKEVLLPVIDQCVLDVNIEEGFVKVHIMDGLLD